MANVEENEGKLQDSFRVLFNGRVKLCVTRANLYTQKRRKRFLRIGVFEEKNFSFPFAASCSLKYRIYTIGLIESYKLL